MAARGCGASRSAAGIYACCGTDTDGMPIEHFIVDPPIRLDFAAMGVTPRGVHLFEDKNGVTHIMDWVGSEHYKNVADYVEETRRYGASRRLSPTLDYSRLTPESRLLLIHARAWVGNMAEYGYWNCPKRIEEHDSEIASPDYKFCCAGVWHEDVEGGEVVEMHGHRISARTVTRKMPSFSYVARCRPDGVIPSYEPAIFLRLPITRLEVVKSEDGRHTKSEEAARKSRLDVSLEDE